MQLLSIPVIVAILEMFKMAGLPTKFAPILSVALGITFGLLVEGLNVQGFGTGLLVGLSAAGLYDTTKPIIKRGTIKEME